MIKPRSLYPNPFQEHDLGPWEERMRPVCLLAIKAALELFKASEITEAILRDDRDRKGIKRYLWNMHHPENGRWKYLGRPFWSTRAYTAWR